MHNLNRTLLLLLKNLDSILSRKEISSLKTIQDSIELWNEGKVLVSITNQDILIAGQSFQKNLTNSGSDHITPAIVERFSAFLEAISCKLDFLNHLGISYFCEDFEVETTKIKSFLQESNIPLHEEPTSEKRQKWLFAGGIDSWKDSLFEFVLNEMSHRENDFWRPHFQIDINTSLTIDELREATDKYLGKDFIKWQLDIPDYGTVLIMGILGNIGNTKIALGIGTNIRGTEYHRKNELKLL